jgi:adenylate cyclase class 2
MAHNNIEIEIQVKVEKVKPLLGFLAKEAAFKYEKRQKDEYFSPADKAKDFLRVRPVREWLRLRDADGKYSLNYKSWHYDRSGKSSHCDEYETNVEDMGQARRILEALGFRRIVLVDKKRKTWTHGDYEIAVDSVKGLGEFVEIEYCGKEKNPDPKKIAGGMIGFLKDIGVGKIERNYVGYPFMLLFPKKVKHEEV